jgi:hypothetical protein
METFWSTDLARINQLWNAIQAIPESERAVMVAGLVPGSLRAALFHAVYSYGIEDTAQGGLLPSIYAATWRRHSVTASPDGGRIRLQDIGVQWAPPRDRTR